MILECLLLSLQRLDAEPTVLYPEQEVQLRARDRGGRPMAGIALRLRQPDGVELDLGRTDARGRLAARPPMAGSYECSMQVPEGPRVIGLFQVVDRPRRWLWALVLTPLGLWLLVWNLQRLREPSRPAA